MNPTPDTPNARCFTHDAMHTTFTIHLTGEVPEFESIVRECVELLDTIEGRLSRFIETSDISRINRLGGGETLYLTDDCHRCLTLAARATEETGGLFDVSQGRRIARLKSGENSPDGHDAGRLLLHPDMAAITCESPGRELDLGGIGKGYALDRLREELQAWGIRGGLLEAGASTLLAFGPDAWPVELAGAGPPVIIALRDQALGASGTDMQGSHIVHPGRDEPHYLSNRVWALAATGAMADAWSTALMLMTRAQVAECLADPTGALLAAFAEMDGRVVSC